MTFTRNLFVGLALILAANAHASTLTYSTDAPGTGFGTGGLFLNSSNGAFATLTFYANIAGTTGVPSGLNYGSFVLTCYDCSTQEDIISPALFDPFTFTIVLTNFSTGGVGTFTGSSQGGVVYSDVSDIAITWTNTLLGSNSTNLDSGTFLNSIFGINGTTAIVAPNSGGLLPGLTTVQGFVTTDPEFPIQEEVPEPTTLVLLGTGLVVLGSGRRIALRRRSPENVMTTSL